LANFWDLNDNNHYRALAISCGSISLHRRLDPFRKAPIDFEPEDLERLANKGPASLSERAVLRFLLHIWSRFEFPFELSQTAGWDAEHRHAFIDWATGRTLGEPCRYF
jgi:hypothetical protein